jgi:hypothetical protein
VSAHAAVELKTLQEFQQRRSGGQGVFVIIGRPSGRVLVQHVTCPFMTDDAFRAKTVKHRGRRGRYVWAPDAPTAIEAYGAVRCRHPSDPV